MQKDIINVLLQNVEQSKDILLNLMYLKHTLNNNHGSIGFRLLHLPTYILAGLI